MNWKKILCTALAVPILYAGASSFKSSTADATEPPPPPLDPPGFFLEQKLKVPKAKNIGQRMPLPPDSNFFLRSETWYYGGKAGVGDLYDRDGDRKWDIVFNYLKCKGEKQGIPYGVYDKFTNNLYLDNNPTDSFVDEEIQNIGARPVDKDAPDCP